MSLRILLFFPDKLSDIVIDNISKIYNYPLYHVNNHTLNKLLYRNESVYQLYSDTSADTGIGMQDSIEHYYNNLEKIEKILGNDRDCRMAADKIDYFITDVNQWISFINNMLNENGFEYIGIMYFMADNITYKCIFKEISQQQCTFYNLKEETLLKLSENTLLTIYK